MSYPGHKSGARVFVTPSGHRVSLVDMNGDVSLLPLRMDEKNPSDCEANTLFDGVNFALLNDMQHGEMVNTSPHLFGLTPEEADPFSDDPIEVYPVLQRYRLKLGIITSRLYDQSDLHFMIPSPISSNFDLIYSLSSANNWISQRYSIRISVFYKEAWKSVTLGSPFQFLDRSVQGVRMTWALTKTYSCLRTECSAENDDHL